ncbi:MAG: histone deacetylase family protein [Gemmatimonadota bacterium]|nr:histone deacetylase family protein [Gemmatimonadota bacterium]
MPMVWSELHRRHEPGGEVWVGVRTPGTEVPERAERIRTEIVAAGATVIEADPHPDDALLAIHDADLLDYLASAWSDWREAGLDVDPGQDRVVPYIFPHPGMLPSGPAAIPTAVTARAGRYAYDTMTLVGPGSWEAARAAADVALTAADLVLGGEPAAYACCRPPGHHATRSAFGGSCYLNNTAAAAARLRDARKSSDGPVAIIDIDAHHGNGTQSIFYEDPRVLSASVHVNPGAGWFPHFLGFGTETGGDGAPGTNRNVSLEPATGDGPWLEAISGLAGWAAGQGAGALVVALGVDAAEADSESPLRVTASGYREAGRILGRLGLPTVVVQEGGYDLESIGMLVRQTLVGLEQGLG